MQMQMLSCLCVAQPCWYCFYSMVQKWVFRPIGATRCPDKREIWHGGADHVPTFTFIGAKMWEYSFQNCQNFKFWPEICTSVVGTNLIHWKNARFHGRVFKMCNLNQLPVFGPLPRAKFHVYRGNVSPLRGEKPIFGPLSKNNNELSSVQFVTLLKQNVLRGCRLAWTDGF